MCSYVGVLAGGTSGGNVVMWKWNGGLVRQSPTGQPLEGPDKWEFLTSSLLSAPAIQIKVKIQFHMVASICDQSRKNEDKYLPFFLNS